MIVCGLIPLSERMARPDVALAVAAGDAIARELARKSLEHAAASPAKATDLATLEPSVRRGG
jgi:hypothetical protein